MKRQNSIAALATNEPSSALSTLPKRPQRTADIASATLMGLAGIHAAWACGVIWPASTSANLARVTCGKEPMPGPVPCWIVAALLTTAAAIVALENRPPAGMPKLGRFVTRSGMIGVATVLTLRSAGVVLSALPVDMDRRFRVLNALVYSPLCAALAWSLWRQVLR